MDSKISGKTFMLAVIGVALFFANMLLTIFGSGFGYPIVGIPIFTVCMWMFGGVTVVTLVIDSRDSAERKSAKKKRSAIRYDDERRAYLKRLISLNGATVTVSAILLATLYLIGENMEVGAVIVGVWMWAVILFLCRMKIIECREEIKRNEGMEQDNK